MLKINKSLSFKSIHYTGMPSHSENRKLIMQAIRNTQKDINSLDKQGINLEFLKAKENSDLVEFYIFHTTGKAVTFVHSSFINAGNFDNIQNCVKKGIDKAQEFLSSKK